MLGGRPARCLATLGGAGLSPVLPGTCGTLVAALPILFIPAAAWPWVPLLGSVAATLICVVLARRLPGKSEGGDPGWFVLDEAAGFWVAVLAPAPPGWPRLLLAFFFFRLFDMVKPPPLRRLERAGGGWGIVLDDLGAGGYALAAATALSLLLPLE